MIALTMNDKSDNKRAESKLSSEHKGEATSDKYSMMYANLAGHFSLPEDATRFVIMVEQFSQFFDDVADGDEVTRDQINLNIFNCFVGLNSNSFFLSHRLQLLPIMELIILKWQGSDIAERAGEANEKSFMWRAAFYDLIMAVVGICHGHLKAIEYAPEVMNYYAETFEEYKEESKIG